MNVLAGADPTGTILAQWGAPGAVIVILGLFVYSTIKRERDRSDRLEKQLEDINQRLIDQFAVLAKDTRDSLTEVNDYLRDLVRRRQR